MAKDKATIHSELDVAFRYLTGGSKDSLQLLQKHLGGDYEAKATKIQRAKNLVKVLTELEYAWQQEHGAPPALPAGSGSGKHAPCDSDSDSNIVEGDVLNFFLHDGFKTTVVAMSPDDFVADLYDLVVEELEEKPVNLTLCFRGKVLLDMNLTLEECGIMRDDTIRVRNGMLAGGGKNTKKFHDKAQEKLNRKEKLLLLKEKAKTLHKGDPDDDDVAPASELDAILRDFAKKLIEAPDDYIVNEIKKMDEANITALKVYVDGVSGHGKKPMDWATAPEFIGFFDKTFKAKATLNKRISEGIKCATTAFKYKIASGFMVDNGSVNMEDLRKAIDNRVKEVKDGEYKKLKLNAKRVEQLKAVVSLEGVVIDSEMQKMITKFNISKEEWQYAKKLMADGDGGMEVDEDL